ncbi:MAG: tyrosine-type recombinase/integrase [Acidimicrobiales bacterium]|nr:tyrosine-type recombinase/integrase [Acidimicrobiales bacterium]
MGEQSKPRKGPRTWGTVKQRASGRWQAQAGPDATGKRASLGTYRTKAEANAALSAAQEQQRRGEWAAPSAGRVTFETIAQRWLATRVTRPSTASRDESYLRSKVLPHLGHLEVGRIDVAVLRSWIAELVRQGLAPATVRKAHQLVLAILNEAVDDRLIAANPALNVRSVPKVPRATRRSLDDDELGRLVEAMDERYRAMVLLGAFGGLRPGELIGLRVGDLDLLRRTVRVERTATDVRGEVILGPPKTDAGRRTVPLPPPVVEALADHVARYGLRGDDVLFPAPKGGHLSLNHWRARFWAPAMKAAEITPPITPHQLRHRAVTTWAQAGVDPTTAAKRAGHESPATLLSVYASAAEGEVPADASIAERAAQVVAGLGSSRSVPVVDLGAVREARNGL